MAFSLNKVGHIANPGNYLNGAVGVVVSGNYAYVISKDDDAVVAINISTPASPSRVGQITQPGNYLNFVRGIASVVDGDYIYVVSKDDDSFVIIDISTPSSPTRIGYLAGAGEYLNEPTGVAVQGNYAYVASTISDALVVIDISTKSSPNRVGQITGAGNYLDGAQGVAVQGNYAYVTSNIQNSLAIFDISIPASPSFVGEIHTAVSGYLDGARGVFVDGDYAYVASYDYDGLAVINISNKLNPTYSDSIIGNLNGAFSVTVDKDYAYIAAQAGDKLTVIDVSNKTAISFKTTIGGAPNYLDGAQGVFVDGYYAYVASSVSDALVVIQITPDAPDAPTNIICTEGEEKNTISWDSVLRADDYNLYWLKYEFFSDEFTSLDLWDQYKDVGSETIEISSDKLRFSNSSGTGCHIVNENNIPSGDFDIELELVTYTPDDNSNGHKAILRTLDVYPFTSVDGAEIYYYVSNAGATYNIVSNIWINSTPYNVSATIAGQPSKIRITRIGNIVTTYYYISSWVSVDNQDFSTRAANLILVTIDTLQTSGNGGITEFDNFDYYVDVKTLGAKITGETSPYEHLLLDGGDNYIYIVTGENPGGESIQSDIVNGTPTFAPPGVPTISGTPGDSQNDIYISTCASAIKYHIYWGLISGVTKSNGTKIEDVTLVDNIYEHLDLTRQNYYYVATSENSEEEGLISNEICIKPDFEGKIFDHIDQINESLLYQYKDKD